MRLGRHMELHSTPLINILRVLYLLQTVQDIHGVSLERKRLAGHHEPGPLHLLEGRAKEDTSGEKGTRQKVQGGKGGHPPAVSGTLTRAAQITGFLVVLCSKQERLRRAPAIMKEAGNLGLLSVQRPQTRLSHWRARRRR